MKYKFWIYGLGLMGIVGLIMLYIYDPAEGGFLPFCPLYATTGFQCPGCGTLRAIHQLLHGNVAAAWSLNPLFILFIPISVLAALYLILNGTLSFKNPQRLLRPKLLWVIVIIIISYGVLRNIF